MENVKRIHRKIPKIGLRIVKSVVAVWLCFLVDHIRDGQGIVFYSQLAALWCMREYRTNTKANAIQRTIGTTIGALYGLFFLIIRDYLQISGRKDKVINEIIISLMIMLVLYTTVLIKKKQASYFSSVVFLSIVVNHLGDANPYIFVWNRFLDTMIGIIIGIGVNQMRIPTKKERKTFFISTMDNTLLDENEKMSDYSKVELNRMIEDGLKFTIATMRTPAIIVEVMKNINLNYPVIAMDGAVLYDIQEKKYLLSYVISAKKSKELRDIFEECKIAYFTNIVIENSLFIYYPVLEDEVQKTMVKELQNSPYRDYIRREVPKEEVVLYYMMLDKKERIDNLYNILKERGYVDELKICMYESTTYKGYWYLKIFNKNATIDNMVKYLLDRFSVKNVMTFGTVQDKYDVCIDEKNPNQVVKMIKKSYEIPLWTQLHRIIHY